MNTEDKLISSFPTRAGSFYNFTIYIIILRPQYDLPFVILHMSYLNGRLYPSGWLFLPMLVMSDESYVEGL